MSSFRDTRALVVGLGVSGHAAARALQREGATVFVTDAARDEALEARAAELREAGIEVELGGHLLATREFDLAVVSPGIPLHADIVSGLRSRGIELISEIELGFRLTRCDILAVTGTNGKTTTTELLAQMLQRA
ncbi:MAG TPA: Mur ligase family protein, partial [Actinomycetota bacterium]|nr:Mur ligase family protein [Actinomycetota bacterium]